MKTRQDDIRTWVSANGKSAVAGIAPNTIVGEKPGGNDKDQPYDTFGRYASAGSPAANGGNGTPTAAAGDGQRRSPLGVDVYQGKKVGKYYILPERVKEANARIALVYSQKNGTIMDMEDRLVAKGYSGAPGHVNAPDDENKPGLGVIPRGTWTIGAVIWNSRESGHKGENLIHLIPDQTTAARVRAMGRDPNSFYIHADSVRHPGTASEGCIIIPEKKERQALRELQGAKIRVAH